MFPCLFAFVCPTTSFVHTALVEVETASQEDELGILFYLECDAAVASEQVERGNNISWFSFCRRRDSNGLKILLASSKNILPTSRKMDGRETPKRTTTSRQLHYHRRSAQPFLFFFSSFSSIGRFPFIVCVHSMSLGGKESFHLRVT